MKKFLLTLFLVGSFSLYIFWQRANPAASAITDVNLPTTTSTSSTPPDDNVTQNNPPASITPPTKTPTPISTPTPAPSGQYKDGTYTGSAADAVYGTLQAQAIISGGKLTDVQFLQFPNSSAHSMQVSSVALPKLKSEAISAQSANVDTVSGATQDSEAFRQTLGAALAQAKA